MREAEKEIRRLKEEKKEWGLEIDKLNEMMIEKEEAILELIECPEKEMINVSRERIEEIQIENKRIMEKRQVENNELKRENEELKRWKTTEEANMKKENNELRREINELRGEINEWERKETNKEINIDKENNIEERIERNILSKIYEQMELCRRIEDRRKEEINPKKKEEVRQEKEIEERRNIGVREKRQQEETNNKERTNEERNVMGDKRRKIAKVTVFVADNTKASYADIMRKARAEVKIKDIGIEEIRTKDIARGGKMLQIIGKDAEEKAKSFMERFREIFKKEEVKIA